MGMEDNGMKDKKKKNQQQIIFFFGFVQNKVELRKEKQSFNWVFFLYLKIDFFFYVWDNDADMLSCLT